MFGHCPKIVCHAITSCKGPDGYQSVFHCCGQCSRPPIWIMFSIFGGTYNSTPLCILCNRFSLLKPSREIHVTLRQTFKHTCKLIYTNWNCQKFKFAFFIVQQFKLNLRNWVVPATIAHSIP